MSRVAAPVDGSVVLFGQQAVGGQQVQINKVGVAREGGAALVRAVGVAGGAEGKICQMVCPALARKSTKSWAGLPMLPMPYPPGRLEIGIRMPLQRLNSIVFFLFSVCTAFRRCVRLRCGGFPLGGKLSAAPPAD